MISTPYPFHPDIEKYVSFLRIPTEAEISDFNHIITFLFFYVQFNPPVFLGPKWERIWSSYLSLIFFKIYFTLQIWNLQLLSLYKDPPC